MTLPRLPSLPVRTSRQRQRDGFSLLELLLVVAVGSVLMLSGLRTYQLVVNANGINIMTRVLVTIQMQVELLYRNQATYGVGNMVDDLVTMRSFPTELGIAGEREAMFAKGPYGLVEVVGERDSYYISLRDVPKAACVRLGQLFLPKSNSRLLEFSVAGNEHSINSDREFFENLQSNLFAECSVNSWQNTMTWSFR